MRVLLAYLDVFASTGGIEKFNRALSKATDELSGEDGFDYMVYSLMDSEPDPRYLDPNRFKGFKGNKLLFAAYVVLGGVKSSLVVLGHINLAGLGWVIRFLKAGVDLVVIAHGIDVWGRLGIFKRWALKRADTVLSVSEFTKNILISKGRAEPENITIFPNTIDPLYPFPDIGEKPHGLMDELGIKNGQKAILTVARLSSAEGYKGYDKVIEAMPGVVAEFPGAKYIIVGRGEDVELERVRKLIVSTEMEQNVLLAGFVGEDRLLDFYGLADVFVLPSRGEGFGIVFLEALACGKPVVAGNRDASREALQGGSLGVLVDPDSVEEIQQAIITVLSGKADEGLFDPYNLRKKTIKEFGFDAFKNRTKEFYSTFMQP